jgi:CRISPR-associated endoribonuclease Cas6
MRIHIKTTANNTIVPFEYQQNLVGSIHKWLGQDNEQHDGLSLFSFSWLKDGKANAKGLNFQNGASWFFSCHDREMLKRIISGIQQFPDIAFGMKVSEIFIEQDKEFKQSGSRFLLGSPVLIKRTIEENNVKHYCFHEQQTADLLKETLQRKMNKVGLNDNSLSICFDESYQAAKTKMVNYKGIKNKANMCPIIIEAEPEILTFAWNVGVGNSTGIGFGSLI